MCVWDAEQSNLRMNREDCVMLSSWKDTSQCLSTTNSSFHLQLHCSGIVVDRLQPTHKTKNISAYISYDKNSENICLSFGWSNNVDNKTRITKNFIYSHIYIDALSCLSISDIKKRYWNLAHILSFDLNQCAYSTRANEKSSSRFIFVCFFSVLL